MRIIVMSDTHNDFRSLQEVIKRNRTADIFIHLGDGAQDVEQMKELYPEYKILNVRGNCDWGATGALAGCFSCGIAKIFYTHGHMYNVKYEKESILLAAQKMQANVVLFGHTHIPMVTYRDGIHLMNPGSLGMPRGYAPSYGVIDITEKEIVCFINEFDG